MVFHSDLNRRHSQKTTKTDPKRDPNTPDFFVEMTDAQRHLFAHKLSELPEVGSEYAEIGESSEDFTKRLADMLLEPKNSGCFIRYWNNSALVLKNPICTNQTGR